MHIAVCMPAYRRQVDVGHIYQALNLAAGMVKAQTHSLDFIHTESCSIEWSRNRLLWQAMQRGADWVLMMDADTFHAKTPDLIRMIETGEDNRAAVIASPVKMRGRIGYNVFEVDNDLVRQADPATWAGTVIPVHRIGTACFAIRAAWIKKHWPTQPWFLTQQLEGDEPRKIGEDVTFCDRVRERGGRILADGRFEPVHVGA
jgi:hypothetical protein